MRTAEFCLAELLDISQAGNRIPTKAPETPIAGES